MRAVLIVVGVAILVFIVSILVQPSKDLSPNPQDEAYKKQEAENKKEQEKMRAGQGKTAPVAKADVPFNPPREGVITTVLTIQGKGDITMELYPKAAPKTVAHVTQLIKGKFYDGIKVHRVEPGFVVQAGDPKSKTEGVDAPGIGSGGSGQNIPFEESKLPNVTSTLAMALSQPHSDTGDSQFFINLKYNDFLDNQYCVFGRVTQGMDVVGKIAKGDTIEKFIVK